jgi:peptidoglycan hydrolase CwlO-like protein
VTAAVEVAVAALRAALEARGEELTRLEAELEDLRGQIAELRTSDVAKDRRIKELEREVEQLRSENAALRAQLDARSGN